MFYFILIFTKKCICNIVVSGHCSSLCTRAIRWGKKQTLKQVYHIFSSLFIYSLYGNITIQKITFLLVNIFNLSTFCHIRTAQIHYKPKCVFKIVCNKLKQSIHPSSTPACPFRVKGSSHWVRDGAHPGWVTWLTKGNSETHRTNNKIHTKRQFREISQELCFSTVGGSQITQWEPTHELREQASCKKKKKNRLWFKPRTFLL